MLSSSFDFTTILQPGDVVAWPQGPGEPQGLTRRLVEQRASLVDPRLFIGMSTTGTLSREAAAGFGITALNAAGTNRRLAATGLIDILPAHVSDVPTLVRERRIKVDVVLLRARSYGRSGTVSTGVIADFTQALVEAARVVVAELDDRLPLTADDALLPVAAIDHLVECDGPECLLPDPEPTALEIAIARIVAERIPDGATIQIGIGSLPVAVCRGLADHRELGIHSGVLPEAVVDLIQRGVVTNAQKDVDRGRTVTGGLFGARGLIELADGNGLISLRSAQHTHAPVVMAGIRNLFAINSALEVDLSGQVNAESVDGRYIGAIGGQADFVRGARLSPGGRSIIALPSTTSDGRRSRVVATLGGNPVTTARADVDMIVTEHGVAELRGCSLDERARRLIAVADPEFREELDRVFHAARKGIGR